MTHGEYTSASIQPFSGRTTQSFNAHAAALYSDFLHDFCLISFFSSFCLYYIFLICSKTSLCDFWHREIISLSFNFHVPQFIVVSLKIQFFSISASHPIALALPVFLVCDIKKALVTAGSLKSQLRRHRFSNLLLSHSSQRKTSTIFNFCNK